MITEVSTVSRKLVPYATLNYSHDKFLLEFSAFDCRILKRLVSLKKEKKQEELHIMG